MLIDFHAHLYKNFNISISLKSALAKEGYVKKVAFLTERSDCSYFKELATICSQIEGLKVTGQQENMIEINSILSIFSGRQYASSEGIEVLSLFCNSEIKDGLPAENYCSEILEQNGIIAFSWAFGKWIGKRGEKIQELSERFGKEKVILLDSGLRPEFIALPAQTESLKLQGFKLLGGSDPLPLTSNQKRILSFGSILEDAVGSDNLESHIRTQLLTKESFDFFGSHSGPVRFLTDQLRLRL